MRRLQGLRVSQKAASERSSRIRAALDIYGTNRGRSVSRIKRLRGLRQPQYRLRVGEVRIFYDVTGTTVQILAIVTKLEADSWLAQFANPE